MKNNLSLVRYDAMCTAIAECLSVDEVKDIRDKAIAIEAYAAQALNTEAERQAREIRIRAERQAGLLLKEMKASGQVAKKEDNLKKGKTPSNSPMSGAATSGKKTLSDFGITRDQSSQWQKLADVPQAEFEEKLASSPMPTTEAIIAKPAPKEVPMPTDEDALWVWGRMKDFRRNGILDRDPVELFQSMTEPMQRDCRQLLPQIIAWLRLMEKHYDARRTSATNRPDSQSVRPL